MHVIFLLEEPSSEALLEGLLPKILPTQTTFELIVFQGKSDLLANLEKRLRGYSKWIPEDYRIVVLIDEDREDCGDLKRQMERAAIAAGLITKTRAKGAAFTVLNRIAVEELEAWFFGDIQALCGAFPRVPPSLASRSQFRDPDSIKGGTWEALERVLKAASYYREGMPKIETARLIAAHMDPTANTSNSFQVFLRGIRSL